MAGFIPHLVMFVIFMYGYGHHGRQHFGEECFIGNCMLSIVFNWPIDCGHGIMIDLELCMLSSSADFQ